MNMAYFSGEHALQLSTFTHTHTHTHTHTLTLTHTNSPVELKFVEEIVEKGDGLDCFAETHFIRQD